MLHSRKLLVVSSSFRRDLEDLQTPATRKQPVVPLTECSSQKPRSRPKPSIPLACAPANQVAPPGNSSFHIAYPTPSYDCTFHRVGIIQTRPELCDGIGMEAASLLDHSAAAARAVQVRKMCNILGAPCCRQSFCRWTGCRCSRKSSCERGLGSSAELSARLHSQTAGTAAAGWPTARCPSTVPAGTPPATGTTRSPPAESIQSKCLIRLCSDLAIACCLLGGYLAPGGPEMT